MEPDKFFLELNGLNLLFLVDDIEKSKYDVEIFNSFFKSVDVTDSAKEAINLLHNKNYDIVLLKTAIKDMPYLEFVKYVKSHYPYLYTAVIADDFDKDELLDAINAGIDGFLKESFDIEVFLGEVYKLLYQKLKIADELNVLQQYKDVVDDSLIVSKTDLKGNITYVNKAFEKVSGFRADELLGKPHSIVRHPDMKPEVFRSLWKTILSKRVWRGLVKNRKKNGESYYVDTVIKPILDRNGDISEFIAIRKDVTRYISAEELINDKLKLIKDALLILVYIDNYEDLRLLYLKDVLDKFKRRLLKRIKILLREKLGLKPSLIEDYIVKDDILGFLIEEYDPNVLENVLKEIINEVINKPIVVESLEFLPFIRMSYSYGISHLYENAIIGIEKIKKGEERLICANGLCKEKRKEVEQNMKMLRVIEKALRENRVISLFQPIVDNKTQKTIKYESLVRIIDEDGKLLSPFFFLDIAKKSGLYTNITLRVIENSFEMLKKGYSISINLSPSDILRDVIKNRIFKLLQEYKISYGQVTFELLEDEIVNFPTALNEFINKALSLNANIAIDDFGSGYSNFGRVVEFKADIIKIDGSLIKDIDKDKVKQNVVEAIVSFAKKENKKTVAEFVENEKIYKILCDLGVDYSQGYYFSKPLRMEEIEKL